MGVFFQIQQSVRTQFVDLEIQKCPWNLIFFENIFLKKSRT